MTASQDKLPHHFLRRVSMGLAILLAIAVVGILYRVIEQKILRKVTEQDSALVVKTITVKKETKEEKIVLPANMEAWHEATLYARTDGYVSQWYFDIGAQVKAGELLAKIDAPEVDAQLRQTQAQLQTAMANHDLAKITAKRWKNLLKTESVSRQETDDRTYNEAAQLAIVANTTADRDRLRELVSFQKVIAPFNGIITARHTDIGRLINAGSSGTVPLFHIVQVDPLRAYVRVPQNYSAHIKPDLKAELHFPQHPDKVFTASLLDTAKAIDATTRTLLIQLQVSNPKNELFAGSYAEAHLTLSNLESAVIIPVNTLIFQAKGMQVVTISNEGRAVFKTIGIGRDFGNTMEVLSGLEPGEKIVLNPPDSMFPGQRVKVQ